MFTTINLLPRKQDDVEVGFCRGNRTVYFKIEDNSATLNVDLTLEMAYNLGKNLILAHDEVNENANGIDFGNVQSN